jgi:hypothetical protein
MPRVQLINKKYNLPQQSRYPRYINKGTTDEKDALPVGENNNQLPETHGSYGALILHPNWKAKRKEVLERDQFRCVICNSGKDLQVHHRQYHFIKATKQFKAPWDYPGHLLITLCSTCHSRGHSKYKVPSINI